MRFRFHVEKRDLTEMENKKGAMWDMDGAF